jgi:hypothetical protein
MSRTEAKMVEITLGESICEKLKVLYFKDVPWADCVGRVAAKFSALKARGRQFYVGQSDVDILRELIKYSTNNLEEMFHVKHNTEVMDERDKRISLSKP